MHVVRTRSIDHTISCLQGIHRQVKARFERHHHPRNVSTNYNYCSSNNNNSSESIKLYQPFSQFQLLYEKKGAATNKQLFGHQLRQVKIIIYFIIILYHVENLLSLQLISITILLIDYNPYINKWLIYCITIIYILLIDFIIYI